MSFTESELGFSGKGHKITSNVIVRGNGNIQESMSDGSVYLGKPQESVGPGQFIPVVLAS